MSYRIATIDRLMAVRWQLTEEKDIPHLRAQVRAFHQQVGKPIFYVSVSGDDTPAPSDDARKAIVKFAEEIIPSCEMFFIVLESQGFRGSVLRSVVASMMILSKDRKSVAVRASVGEVLRMIQPGLLHSEEEVLRRLRAAKIIVGG